MDNGEFIKNGYMIEPGDGGSWLAWQGSGRRDYGGGMYREGRGFTSWADLVAWISVEHASVERQARGAATPNAEGADVSRK